MNTWLQRALSLENQRAHERYLDEDTFRRIHPEPGEAWNHCPRVDWMLNLLAGSGEARPGWEKDLRHFVLDLLEVAYQGTPEAFSCRSLHLRALLKGWLEERATSTELEQQRRALTRSAENLHARARYDGGFEEIYWALKALAEVADPEVGGAALVRACFPVVEQAVSQLAWLARPALVGSPGRELVLCALAPALRRALGPW